MIEKHYILPNAWIKRLPVLGRIFWVLEAFILRTIVWVMRILSVQHSYDFAARLCQIIEPLTPFTAKFQRNLAVAFPEKSAQEIRQIAINGCANIGRALADLVLAKRIWTEREERIEFVSENGIDLNKMSGQSFVFVTAHVGAWQLSSFVAAQYNRTITSVYAPESNPYLGKLVSRLRSGLPCQFLPKKGCMRQLMKTLKQGNIAGFVPDLRLDGGVQLPFFGVKTPSNTTAARMALHHGCALVPIRAERLPGCRFKITIGTPIQPDDPSASIDEQVKQMTQKQLDLFETWIRDTPDQWLCVGRRWEEDVYVRPANTMDIQNNLGLQE